MVISRKGLILAPEQTASILFLVHASVLGWKFVGSDITDIAIEWANQNVNINPHISNLIEIRRVCVEDKTYHVEESENSQSCSSEGRVQSSNAEAQNTNNLVSSVLETHSDVQKRNNGKPVLLGIVRDGESFDFCKCNPPFSETMEAAGLNPKTSSGGTPEEKVVHFYGWKKTEP